MISHLIQTIILQSITCAQRSMPNKEITVGWIMQELERSADFRFIVQGELRSMVDQGVIYECHPHGYRIGPGPKPADDLAAEVRKLVELLERHLGDKP